jgi:hypothetical protein
VKGEKKSERREKNEEKGDLVSRQQMPHEIRDRGGLGRRCE